MISKVEDFWKNLLHPHILGLLAILLIVDIGFVAIDAYFHFTGYTVTWSVTEENSVPGICQYLKEIAAAVLLILVARKTRIRGFFIWAYLSLYLFFDDIIQLHEAAGGIVRNLTKWDMFLGLRDQDFGELGFSLIVGTIFLVCLVKAYQKGDPFFRIASRGLFASFFLLAFFGIVVDMLAIMLSDLRGPTFEWGLNTLEDGGEMFALSIIVTFCFYLYQRSNAVAES